MRKPGAAGKKIHIAGIGPGNLELVSFCAMEAIKSCDVLVGGRRNLELFKYLEKEEFVIESDLDNVCNYILENAESKSITVIATGDPGIFSISGYLKKRLKDIKIEIIPGISSLQYFCSRLGTSWNDIAIVSLHGRQEDNLSQIIRKNRKTAVFTGMGTSPSHVCRRLIGFGIHNACVTVGEKLSYPEERIISGTPEEIAEMSFDPLSLVLVENDSPGDSGPLWEFSTPGIPDHLFIRGKVPMTKEEVRVNALAKLRLKEESIVFDIGAGTGSVSIECGIICKKGKVYAVERHREAICLIKQNIKKFDINNVCTVEGYAPFVLDSLPAPDRIFIGGSGGCMDEILAWIVKSVKKTRVVANAVTPESVYKVLNGFKNYDFKDVEILNVGISKGHKAGEKHIMKALNPVYIISGQIG